MMLEAGEFPSTSSAASSVTQTSINITVDIYGHVSDNGAIEAAMETLGRLLND